MRFNWRDQRLENHDSWLSRIDLKNRKQGTSAPTLADVWAGPIAVSSVLAGAPGLEDFVATSVTVEAQTRFDGNSRGPRNHDLLVVGDAKAGRVVVSVEAKAGEPYGETLGAYRASGAATSGSGKAARLQGLINALAPQLSLDDPAVLGLRWQLFTGLAGAIAAAVDVKAPYAVFLVHEFLTDENTPERRTANNADLKTFGQRALGRDLPVGDAPWCAGPLAFQGDDRLDPKVRLYLGKAVTDLRPARFAVT